MKMTSIVILVTPFLVLAGTAVAVMTERANLAFLIPAPVASRRSCTRSPRRPITTAVRLPGSRRIPRSITPSWLG